VILTGLVASLLAVFATTLNDARNARRGLVHFISWYDWFRTDHEITQKAWQSSNCESKMPRERYDWVLRLVELDPATEADKAIGSKKVQLIQTLGPPIGPGVRCSTEAFMVSPSKVFDGWPASLLITSGMHELRFAPLRYGAHTDECARRASDMATRFLAIYNMRILTHPEASVIRRFCTPALSAFFTQSAPPRSKVASDRDVPQ
jgi:hypothetical protein